MKWGGAKSIAEWSALALGFLFLYGPIAILVVMSFNASRLVTVWGGFSTKWYFALLSDEQMLDAARTSLGAAALSALIATFNGLLAALALARFGRFRTRTLFFSAIYAPLVLPEVVLGLSLQLCFVALGIDRGFWTLVIAHATFIVPSVASAYLLAFTLSLDDLVIASFATGPGATTLPMRIYSQVRLGVSPEVNAISTLLLAFVATVLTLVAVATRRRSGGG
jgi:putrescine transport system permease protein